ncbi:hypothetical protein RBH29_13395 [Herbivorax sp. ANBcel31]|uniref:hypothetical protein n=1 Tax=Herbivorax sp. ANBcel31 TaxID=3069754 RepID=UPI0027B81E20|nr:hypothetical protein [Herbivorax sp. ANBcel31]MDQ2087421.1 hypothetical protein [Herbivorax sp. ANBcel31]
MKNEEFQKLVLEQLSGLKDDVTGLKDDVTGLKDDVTRLKGDVTGLKTRQDEIYHVVKAIEHSNQVGKAELDKHEFRIAKVEGKFKKVAKVMDEDSDKASNL